MEVRNLNTQGPSIPYTIITTAPNNEPPFDFSFDWTIAPPFLTPQSDGYMHLNTCGRGTSLRPIQLPSLSVEVISGTAQQVSLYVSDLPARITSVSFSTVSRVPPFQSTATVNWSNAPVSTDSHEIVSLVMYARSGATIHSLGISMDIDPRCP